MKFKFRLERTADFFSKKERAKQLELARVHSEIEQIKQQISQLETENRSVFERGSSGQEMTGAWAKLLFDRVEFNLKSVDGLSEQMLQVKEVLEEKKKELLEISQRRRALEKLKDKKLSEFKLLSSRKEQKQLDENYQLLEPLKK